MGTIKLKNIRTYSYHGCLIEEGKNGYLYDCNQADRLSFYIDSIYKDDLVAFSKVSLQMANKYTIEQMVADHVELFDKIKK